MIVSMSGSRYAQQTIVREVAVATEVMQSIPEDCRHMYYEESFVFRYILTSNTSTLATDGQNHNL